MKKESIIELEKKWAELLKGPKRTNEPKIKMMSITAEKLDLQLQQDDEYQSWLKEKEKILSLLQSEYRKDEQPLIKDLAKIGLDIRSSWDLVNTKSKYKIAVPILIKHLFKPYHLKNKEGIIRALAVKEAVGQANEPLFVLYHQIPKDERSLRWVIGNTIYVIALQDDLDDILSIVQDKSNGESRQPFVLALGKLKAEKIEDVLIDLLNDEDVILQVLTVLGKLKFSKAKDKILNLAQNATPEVRKAALKVWNKM